MIPLVLTQDGLGRVAVGMRQPSHVDYLKLVADTGATLTVPTGAKHVLFSCSTNFFVQYTSTALTSAVYAASVTDGTALEQNPELRSLSSVTGLGIIAKAAGDLTLSWFG
jgi:hypothetical protein